MFRPVFKYQSLRMRCKRSYRLYHHRGLYIDNKKYTKGNDDSETAYILKLHGVLVEEKVGCLYSYYLYCLIICMLSYCILIFWRRFILKSQLKCHLLRQNMLALQLLLLLSCSCMERQTSRLPECFIICDRSGICIIRDLTQSAIMSRFSVKFVMVKQDGKKCCKNHMYFGLNCLQDIQITSPTDISRKTQALTTPLKNAIVVSVAGPRRWP